MLKPDEQQHLFENTARAIREASKEVQDRHIGNCSKADPAYGHQAYMLNETTAHHSHAVSAIHAEASAWNSFWRMSVVSVVLCRDFN
jgi:hypothetical protein